MNRCAKYAVWALCWMQACMAQAALRVMACEPEWGALVQEIGARQIELTVATTAMQDPHQIQARPSLLAKARQADLLVCTGAELEAGWLPLLQQQSGNARIQYGQPGLFLAADVVPKLGVPSRVDRSQGDVHASGNPHIQTSPYHILRVARALSERLQQIDPAQSTAYARGWADFERRWQAAMVRWNARAAPLRGLAVVSQHQAFVYLYDWLGLVEVAVLEPKPGVEPSVQHLQGVMQALGVRPARMSLYAAYQDSRPSQWLQKNAGVPAVMLPFTVGGTPQAQDLFALFDDTLDRLLQAAGARP